jgi:hypothetical protein
MPGVFSLGGGLCQGDSGKAVRGVVVLALSKAEGKKV